MTRADVINGAIGPFDDYCDGYGNPGASGIGYVSVLKLSTGSFSGPKRRGASHCYRDPMCSRLQGRCRAYWGLHRNRSAPAGQLAPGDYW